MRKDAIADLTTSHVLIYLPNRFARPEEPVEAVLLVIRLQGVLISAEQHLVKTLQTEKGRYLLQQVRIQLMEAARPILEAMFHEITTVKVRSLHHDSSTVTGEEMVIFTLTTPPAFRAVKPK